MEDAVRDTSGDEPTVGEADDSVARQDCRRAKHPKRQYDLSCTSPSLNSYVVCQMLVSGQMPRSMKSFEVSQDVSGVK